MFWLPLSSYMNGNPQCIFFIMHIWEEEYFFLSEQNSKAEQWMLWFLLNLHSCCRLVFQWRNIKQIYIQKYPVKLVFSLCSDNATIKHNFPQVHLHLGRENSSHNEWESKEENKSKKYFYLHTLFSNDWVHFSSTPKHYALIWLPQSNFFHTNYATS